jgi:hypothetical protein
MWRHTSISSYIYIYRGALKHGQISYSFEYIQNTNQVSECRVTIIHNQLHEKKSLLEKLTVAHLVKFLVIYRTQSLSNAFSKFRYWSLS